MAQRFLFREHGKYVFFERDDEYETIIEKDGKPIAEKLKTVRFKIHFFSRKQLLD